MRASTWIPIFDVDNSLDAGTIPRKITTFVMGIKRSTLALRCFSPPFCCYTFLNFCYRSQHFIRNLLHLTSCCVEQEVGGVACLLCLMIGIILYHCSTGSFHVYMNHFFPFFNSQFLAKVQEKFHKDTELIVACQKGLR